MGASYWSNPPEAGLNQPENYRAVSPERSIYLIDLFNRLRVSKDASVLEVGPNCGRNLAWLYEHGWRSLSGVEINPDAVAKLRLWYPQLRDADIRTGKIEDVSPSLEKRKYVTFSMAVLCHLPYSSNWVFKSLAQASTLIITIEDERLKEEIHYPRDYREVFTRLGMKQILAESCRGIKGLGSNYVTRAFTHAD
jgi:phospholipid N-methyltransferase